MEIDSSNRAEVLERRRERMEALAQTGRATGMGNLLRKFWHPVAVADQIAVGKGMPIQIMGEELTLYRGASGTPYLVAGRCAHRLTLLHTGWIEGENIRCMYHGWQYNGSGKCVNQPGERDPLKHDLTPAPELPGVPLMKQFYPNIVAYAFHGIWGPPGMAPDRFKILREAFEATLKDPEFLKDAERGKIETELVTGAQIDDILKAAATASPDVLERVKKVLDR